MGGLKEIMLDIDNTWKQLLNVIMIFKGNILQVTTFVD
jgi:hypothetical protein